MAFVSVCSCSSVGAWSGSNGAKSRVALSCRSDKWNNSGRPAAQVCVKYARGSGVLRSVRGNSLLHMALSEKELLKPKSSSNASKPSSPSSPSASDRVDAPTEHAQDVSVSSDAEILTALSTSVAKAGSVKASKRKGTWGWWWPRLCALAVAACWGTNFGVVKIVQDAMANDMELAAALRFTVAALATSFAISPGMPLSCVVGGVLVGFADFFGYMCQSYSLLHVDAGKTAFLCSLTVMVVPFLSSLTYFASKHLGNEKPGERAALADGEDLPQQPWLAAFLAVIGIFIMELAGEGASFSLPDFVALGQAFGFGAGFVINQHFVRKAPQHVLGLTAIQLVVIAVCSIVWSLVDNSGGNIGQSWHVLVEAFTGIVQPPWDFRVIGGVLYAGLISTAATIWLANAVLKDISAGDLSVILCTEPIFAAAFASLTLGESLGPNTWLGGGLIVAACLFAEFEFGKKEETAPVSTQVPEQAGGAVAASLASTRADESLADVDHANDDSLAP
ncbi:hypothetical protein FVE85_5223 [Porphyridium purpureum]|uniref:EamA domain-containing protein n=1 Tax=Porphyridium purpureum TaxID=35688 RepID=A0A5J4Z319_PORPP|nr:hypothetical protein FVE85_5223 [Porphyridium purpureum]|eukprot:POR3680..scf295_1